jgi:hypothetical protein|tara:strand:- start:976 stop:1155 length:180 start_codon:yes stop_codon:yes gene_type:complete
VNDAEEDARRRTNESANFDGFTRFFPSFLSLFLSVLNNVSIAVLLLRLFNLGERERVGV